MPELREITNLKRWRDVGDGPATYCAGDKQFGDDVNVLLREHDRLAAALESKSQLLTAAYKLLSRPATA